jgi:hypothetical protein
MLFTCPLLATAGEPGKLQFNRDIRPILTETCFFCHGTDKNKREADLRFDIREDAIQHGALIPGKPDESAMIRRLFTDNKDELMPPPASHKVLTEKQKQTLKQWVAEGAEYQEHWAFIPPVKTNPPTVKNQGWVRNPIDAFVLAKLEQEGLTPAPEADRNTLARRIALDVTGLPPAPELLETFLKDQSPQAYENYIDTLMNSPRWGEHRARYWLDLARYADTHGIHFDNYREIWAYRDWVIAAFNDNMPFDQMTIEQLAGDLLPDATREQQIASGFHRCNTTTNEGGIIDEEYQVLYARDRTETTAQVWMGLTAGCAVCHDHKYDPITAKDFYSLSAFFNNTTQAVKDGNVKNTPPIIVVPRPEDDDQYANLTAEQIKAHQRVEDRRHRSMDDFKNWFTQFHASQSNIPLPTADLELHLPLQGQMSTIPDGQLLDYTLNNQPQQEFISGLNYASRDEQHTAITINATTNISIPNAGNYDNKQAFSFGAWILNPTAKSGAYAIMARMNEKENHKGWDMWMEDQKLATHILHSWPDDGLKVVTKDKVPTDKWIHAFITYDGSQKASGVKIYINGAEVKTETRSDKLKSSIKSETPFKVGQRSQGTKAVDVKISDVRLYARALSAMDVKQLSDSDHLQSLVAKKYDDLKQKEVKELHQWWFETIDPEAIAASAHKQNIERQLKEVEARGTIAHVMHEKEQEPTAYVLFRGEYDQRRDQVSAATPGVLPEFPSTLPKNRLGLARWLVQDNQPLTARVTVNQFWQQIFGSGLVKTAGDFGTTGTPPSHPELLDWLAIDFREHGWDIKRFYKQVLLSSTYRQSAVTTPEKQERDPQNTWLSRGPRYRMDAEMVRDVALYVSGLLSPQIGGRSVKPYQPPGVWEAVAMRGSDTRDYAQDHGDNLYKRSMYTFWKRSAPPASLEIMNAPSREFCVVCRERTNTPMQALVTLNDTQFIEAARVLAGHTLLAQTDTPARLHFISERLISRDFTAEELAVIEPSLKALTSFYHAHPEDAAQLIKVGEAPVPDKVDPWELAAWTMLCNELLNLDEVLNK